jgi:alkanesulfonate monooxygenase SsuD/methylene tetrahydromethanopterin reductase-like flavin-dependent oxidoreductase (luciferase family)
MIHATSQITVGFGLAIAPLHDPVRIAEDAAFLDVLSAGRFALGMAIGYRPIEYEGFGTTQRDRVGRLEETVAICRQAWAAGHMHHEGTHFTRSGFSVTPKPVQPNGPEIMLGGHHPNAIDRAARIGDRFCMDAGTDSESYESGAGRNRGLILRVESALNLYKEALQRHGKDPTAPRFALNVGGFLHPDGPDAAWDTVEAAYLMTRRVYGDWYGLDPSEYERWQPGELTPAELAQRRSELLLGTPNDLLGVFTEVRELVGENLSVMFRSKYPLVDDRATRQSIALLAELREELIA